jgi:tetratricopeptide (TPR) repeat protein
VIDSCGPIGTRTTHSATRKRTSLAMVIAVLISVRLFAVQDFPRRAQELYEAADYEGALAVLDEAGEGASQGQRAREYRALCLLALERVDDMEKTIEQMIQFDPLYRPAESQPPRLRTAFDRIHRRLLPSIVRERYLQAKANLEQMRYADSAAGFELVLRLLKERDEEPEAGKWPDDQLRADFEAISRLRLDATRAAQAPPPVPQIQAFYRSTDAGVIPPVPIRQEIPPWQSDDVAAGAFEGELELLIDTRGDVQEVRIAVPIHPAYDPVILRAAAKWKYRPATKDGRPVVYRKSITISLMPQKSRPTTM